MSFTLLIASGDEQVRDLLRDTAANTPNARIVAEYPEVSANLYIRVLQDVERHPDAALFLDISSDPVNGIKALEKLKQAVPDLYVIVSDYSEDGESILLTIRSGANDYLTMPLKRSDLRDALTRLERTPRRAIAGGSQLGRIYTFLGAKGGVGTTALAVNFATILSQRKKQTVLLDLDWPSNAVAMQVGAAPQYTLVEVGENLDRMDQSLFEGFVLRDPAGFFVVGPPDSLEQPRTLFTDSMLREFTTFLVEKYDSIVMDAGCDISNELTLAALQVSSTVFIVTTQEFPAIRNTQRYLGYLMRLGFTQDQIKIVINRYQKKGGSQVASLEQVQQTLNQPVFYGIPDSPAMLASINRARPLTTDRQAFPELDRVLRSFADKATGVKKELAQTA
ncbi:MAG: MinD/ParA family protein [Acidobacteria bacterium]|nr:MinD/ParA family protein [Acidobacteriota bacterium]